MVTYKSGENCRESALQQDEYGPRQAPIAREEGFCSDRTSVGIVSAVW